MLTMFNCSANNFHLLVFCSEHYYHNRFDVGFRAYGRVEWFPSFRRQKYGCGAWCLSSDAVLDVGENF